MTRIAFLGLGAMGRRMAARLVAAGHDVTVWNRTMPLAPPDGAHLAATAREAALGAEMVVSMVRDDAASEQVWLDERSGAIAGMADGALGVEASTVTPRQARRLHRVAALRGVAFLDCPLAGSRPQAEAGQLIFMAGGDETVVARAEPVLRAMGTAVHHAGAAGAGATVKLLLNGLFCTQVAAVAELLAMAGKAGVDRARAMAIVGATPVAGPAVARAAAAMLAGGAAPAFPIDLAEKDLSFAVETAATAGAALPLTGAVRAIFAAARSEGLGALDVTGIVRRYDTAAGTA